MLVSAIHQPESAIGIHLSPLSWTSLPPPTHSRPSRLLQSLVWVPGVILQIPTGSLFDKRQRICWEKAMAPHSGTLAWKIPWTEEPGRLQSMGLRRVRHDWATSLSLFTFMHWRRKRQPTPVFLPGESQGQWGQVGCHLWGRTESDTTEVT